MTTKPKATPLKKLLVLVSIGIISCYSGTNKTLNNEKEIIVKQENVPQNHIDNTLIKVQDTTAIKKQILNFLVLQQQLLKDDRIDLVANHVKFPLDGDVLYVMLFGYEFLESPNKFFEEKVSQDIFLQKKDSIFTPFYKKIFCGVNFSKELNDSKYTYKVKYKNYTWDLSIGIGYADNYFSVYISRITDNSEEEYAVHYRYSLSNKRYKLTYIGAIG